MPFKFASQIKTIEQWKNNQTTDPPCPCYYVLSETRPNYFYFVINHGNGYICTCPAWKHCLYNKNQNIDQRTCKHIIAIRGESAERDRICANKGVWS